MAEENRGLTDADRKAIADIRRELDAEFGPVEAGTPLAADDEPRAAGDEFVLPRIVDDSRERPWSARAGVIAAFVAGLLIGAVLGAVATIAFLGQQQDAPTARAVSPPPVTGQAQDTTARTPSDPVAASAREAVDEWIDATRRGDVAAQMRFYPDRVPVYYMWRDVPREQVRADKDKLFGTATRLLIATDTPTVDVAGDGTAITRFRKRYVIEGPEVQRKGEVLQELRWKRTGTRWLIVSERDTRVIASD